jgi:hypothetical protein
MNGVVLAEGIDNGNGSYVPQSEDLRVVEFFPSVHDPKRLEARVYRRRD